MRRTLVFGAIAGLCLSGFTPLARAEDSIDAPTLPPRMDQAQVEEAKRFLEVQCVRREGLRFFGNPNTLADGFGDGPHDPTRSALELGNRVTFPNTPISRLFGLDSQSCGECHSIRSARTVPAQFAIGGTNTFSQPVLVLQGNVDTGDADGNGVLDFNGRVINAPALWGAGGIEALAKEATIDLQKLRQTALDNPGTEINLVTRSGVDFGSLQCNEAGDCDTSKLQGIRPELVVRPFGRRGDNFSIRDISVLAALFQLGMQPTEVVGEIDADGDGVANEFTEGEISAMTLWQAGLEPPRQTRLSREARSGKQAFGEFGCADCHIPSLSTRSARVTFSFPEVPEDPTANVFQSLSLLQIGFDRDSDTDGVRVPAFTDLKLHDMGPGLTDQPAGDPGTSLFVTIALWGVADSAPYLHDGRALTINDAILQHDGEGLTSRNAYANASVEKRKQLLAFLGTLRAPTDPNGRLLSLSEEFCQGR